MNPVFELAHIQFFWGEKQIISNLNFTFSAGKKFALLGPNGVGKSTLLRLFARHIVPAGGSISFKGKPLLSWPACDLAKSLAYLPQEIPQWRGWRVRELVSLVLQKRGIPSKLLIPQIKDILYQLKLESFSHALFEELSTGQKQKVRLAMILAQGADVFLLDEVTTALDPAAQSELISLLNDLCRKIHGTLIVATHDLLLASRMADDILLFQEGKILHQISSTDIFTHPSLKELYGSSFNVPHFVYET